jgi:hypothetical protein
MIGEEGRVGGTFRAVCLYYFRALHLDPALISTTAAGASILSSVVPKLPERTESRLVLSGKLQVSSDVLRGRMTLYVRPDPGTHRLRCALTPSAGRASAPRSDPRVYQRARRRRVVKARDARRHRQVREGEAALDERRRDADRFGQGRTARDAQNSLQFERGEWRACLLPRGQDGRGADADGGESSRVARRDMEPGHRPTVDGSHASHR